jgi:hypothetical protein
MQRRGREGGRFRFSRRRIQRQNQRLVSGLIFIPIFFVFLQAEAGNGEAKTNNA